MGWIILLTGLFIILLLIGAPVFAALVVPSILYLLISDVPLTTIPYKFYFFLDQFPLIAVPLFILVGNLATHCGVSEKIFRFARTLFQGRTGYSLRLNVIMSLIFSGISGSAIADIGCLGPIEIKAMESEGYSRRFAAALTIATAAIGPIFPPSIALIVYATAAQISSVRCLVAGAFPALVLTGLLYLYAVYVTPRKLGKTRAEIKQTRTTFDDRFFPAFIDSFPVLLLAPLVVTSMLVGLFSPSEAGAAAVVYITLLGLVYRTLTIRRFYLALKETLLTSAGILGILVAANLLSSILLIEGLSDAVANFLLGFSKNALVVLFAINIILLILGCFIDGLPVILLLTPILLPVTNKLGIDPVHLGVVMTLNTMIGMLTPPFGMSLFAIAKVANIKISEVVRELPALMLVEIVALVIITIFPSISLWLPNLAFGK
jgi:tripartite ATP-independent transporter DctM subunit